MEDRLSQPFLLPVSLPTAPAPFILRRSQLLLPLRLLAPTSCRSWQRHWAIGLFPVSSLRQILGQRAMWITRPFAFAHACPYLLPSLAKALGYSVSSPSHPWDRYWDKERCGSAPFAFAHACPYLLPFLAKALGYWSFPRLIPETDTGTKRDADHSSFRFCAFLPLPLAIPGKGTGLFRLFPVSSLRQILGQRAMWTPRGLGPPAVFSGPLAHTAQVLRTVPCSKDCPGEACGPGPAKAVPAATNAAWMMKQKQQHQRQEQRQATH